MRACENKAYVSPHPRDGRERERERETAQTLINIWGLAPSSLSSLSLLSSILSRRRTKERRSTKNAGLTQKEEEEEGRIRKQH